MKSIFLGRAICAAVALFAFWLTPSASASWGGCYDLEIIAQLSKNVSGNTNNGQRIFILENGNTKINLREGSSFQVLDYNGTDGSASFQMPAPVDSSGNLIYNVYARMVGKPGSLVNMQTCAYDALGTLYCSQQSLSMKRIAGSSKFENVSNDLLYVYAVINGTLQQVPLFSSTLEDYFWNVDSTGKAHAQLRFCPA